MNLNSENKLSSTGVLVSFSAVLIHAKVIKEEESSAEKRE